MLDLNEKVKIIVDLNEEGSNSEEKCVKTPVISSEEGSSQARICVQCGASKTPLWRSGPTGPKTLCNACGIRSKKKKKPVSGLDKAENKKARKSAAANDTHNPVYDQELAESLRRRLGPLVRDKYKVEWEPKSTIPERRPKLSQEQEAALLLMAFSLGAVAV